EIIENLARQIDIIEVYNGRALAQDRSSQAVVFAKLNQMIGVASSDAHGYLGLGKTYTRVANMPNQINMLEVLTDGTPIVSNPSIRELLYPSFHRLLKKVKKPK